MHNEQNRTQSKKTERSVIEEGRRVRQRIEIGWGGGKGRHAHTLAVLGVFLGHVGATELALGTYGVFVLGAEQLVGAAGGALGLWAYAVGSSGALALEKRPADAPVAVRIGGRRLGRELLLARLAHHRPDRCGLLGQTSGVRCGAVRSAVARGMG